jgi:hypothetical protein
VMVLWRFWLLAIATSIKYASLTVFIKYNNVRSMVMVSSISYCGPVSVQLTVAVLCHGLWPILIKRYWWSLWQSTVDGQFLMDRLATGLWRWEESLEMVHDMHWLYVELVLISIGIFCICVLLLLLLLFAVAVVAVAIAKLN